MNGVYNFNLVALSYLIAVFASYTALDMAGRVTASKGRMALIWLAGGAVAMGTGIWSMHFIGMLAFKLPIPVGYDLAITLFSLVAAVIVSAIALYIVSRSQLTPKTVAVGAVLMGTGICIMHYSGMAAMRMQPGIEYDPLLFAASALIAVTASAVALFIAFKLRDAISRKIYLFRGGAALVMGLAIVGMHYTGMAAANFAPNSLCLARDSLTGNWTATPVSLFTIALLAISLALSVLDARMRARAEAAATTEAARRKAEEERARTEFLAWHDPATGLANKAHLKHQFVQAIAAARACHGSFSLLYFRIDNYGELVRQLDDEGINQLLKRLGERVMAHFTQPDDFGRWGDREFMGMLAGAPNDAKFRADLRRVLNALCEPVVVDGLPLQLTLSLGSSVYPRDGESTTILINAAIQQAKPVSVKDLGTMPGAAEIPGRGSLAPAGGAPAAC